jgi:hypothetical protein
VSLRTADTHGIKTPQFSLVTLDRNEDAESMIDHTGVTVDDFARSRAISRESMIGSIEAEP